MAGKTAVLSIRIIADGKQAGKEFANTNSELAKFDDGARKASIGAGIAVAGLAALATAAGNSASDLQQATGAVESVYGAHSAEVKKMADEAATNVGLAKSEYMQLSSVIGSQLKNMGVPMEAVAGQTGDLVSLGADLAATFGGTTSDAVSALSSLLRGERDPIERYGVSIKQADVNARLAQMGMAGLEGEAAKAAETQATLSLLTEQTAAAYGQFGREADTAAGAQQIATAEWENAQAALGERLLPIMADLAGMLSDVAKWVSENTELVSAIAIVVGTFAGAILLANGALAAYRTIAAVATAAQIAWNVAMSANPLGIIILAIGAVIAAIVWLIANWEEVGRIAGEVWDNIVAAIDVAIGWIQDAIGWIGSLFGAAGATGGAAAGIAAADTPPVTPQVASFSAQALAPAPTSSSGGWSAWADSSTPMIREGDTYIDVRGVLTEDEAGRTIEGVMNKRKTRTGRTPAFAGGDSRWR